MFSNNKGNFTFRWGAKGSHRRNATQFQIDAFDQARRATNAPNGVGILHALTTILEHQALHPGIAIAVLQHPGVMPVGPANAIKIWEHSERAFDIQQDAVRQFTNHLTTDSGIPADIIRNMQDGANGMSTRSLPWIFNYIRTNYAGLNPQDIEELLAEFSIRWDPSTDIRTYLHDKLQIWRDLAANHCAMNPYDTYKHARLWFSEHFNQCWTDHARAHPTLATYNVEHLFADIIAFRESSLPQLTTAQAGYHAAAVVQKIMHLSDEESFAANMAVYEKSRQKPKPTFTHYCHTHGPNNCATHTSMLCDNPASGHKKKATLTNRMGGKNHRSESP